MAEFALVPFSSKLVGACSIQNAFVRYKSRSIFKGDGKKYYQNGLKVLQQKESKSVKMPILGPNRKLRIKNKILQEEKEIQKANLDKERVEKEQEEHVQIQKRQKDMFKHFRKSLRMSKSRIENIPTIFEENLSLVNESIEEKQDEKDSMSQYDKSSERDQSQNDSMLETNKDMLNDMQSDEQINIVPTFKTCIEPAQASQSPRLQAEEPKINLNIKIKKKRAKNKISLKAFNLDNLKVKKKVRKMRNQSIYTKRLLGRIWFNVVANSSSYRDSQAMSAHKTLQQSPSETLPDIRQHEPSHSRSNSIDPFGSKQSINSIISACDDYSSQEVNFLFDT